MVIQENLCSFHVIDRNQILLTWSYPSIEEYDRKLLLQNITKLRSSFYYIFSNNKWIYVYENNITEQIDSFVICVLAKNYEPQKYEKICSVLWDNFKSTKSGPELVKIYLSLFIKNFYTMKLNGNLIVHDFRNHKEQIYIKDFIKSFGPEVIIIYVALLLKKRIFVYHYDVNLLQKSLESITKFVPRNKPNEYLRPLVQNIEDIKGKMHFIAGTINRNLETAKSIYDIFIDLSKYHIIVLPHAKDHLILTKFHKDFAKQLYQMANTDEITDEELFNAINNKTVELRKQLENLTSTKVPDNKQMLTIEDLRSKNFNSNLENFLFNYALAENIMML